MLSIKRINPNGLRVFMGVLTGGEEIHPALEKVAIAHNMKAAAFEMLGGLSEVEFRGFDFEGKKRGSPIVFTRAMEIVSGHGTISLLEDQPTVHTHFSVAFRDTESPHGIAVVGGHVTHAIAHAVEFTVTAYDGVSVHRALDPATGLLLWDLPSHNP